MKRFWAAAAGAGVLMGVLGGAARLSQEDPAARPPAPAAEPCVAGVVRLGFMAGDWTHTDESGTWEERWSAPLGGCIVGSLRWVRQGQPRMYEMLAIEEDEHGHVRMFVRHFNKGLEPWASEADKTPTWTLTEVEKGRAVFEDPSRGFPAKMTYEAGPGPDPDRMTVRLEGVENGATRLIVFEFRRMGGVTEGAE